MINLVVGSPGHGKTQFVVSKILEMIAENEKLEKEGKQKRQIFCDIKGLMIPDVDPAPDDWRDAPDGAIIIYDEVQYRKAYEYKGNVYSQDEMIKDLTTHRHTNKDLWLITQDSQRIEKGIHKLIDQLYYIKRPASKPNYTNVFVFDKWLANPEPAANRNAKHKKYLDFYRFYFKDEYQKLYTSATDHSSVKFKLPKQLFVFGGLVLAIIFFVFIALMNTNTFDTKRFEKAATSDDTLPASSPVEIDTRTPEEREKERREQFNNELQRVSYNINKPYEQDIEYQYEVLQKPMLSGCVVLDKTCTCYTQQATKLDVSQADCKKYMSGERPFNPFLDVQQVQQLEQSTQQKTLEDIARYQQAKEQGLI